ncbi:imidazolonepropionase-like amidohydrolase [Natronospira proteinivora]|uniref:Imidazolonepropionase-like amidohydrolase n=1 Tax=Natronospira proteinivora TaxID=1807133 RepID=A0ABT1GAN7_9GAMM|nr:amidohydrolase [Natronospira proteinivora]MCP1728372.1 imidazolonepropionase-like amidohydrolase [Natronospira proteinivora]
MAIPPLKNALVAGAVGLALGLSACGESDPPAPDAEDLDISVLQDNFESTYQPLPPEHVVITNATILVGNGERLDKGSIHIRDGKIKAIAEEMDVPGDAQVVDAEGGWVTPGIIDSHSHLGVYPSPGVWAHADGNEMVSPNTAHVSAEHGLWPQDPGFLRAIEGGVTSALILPGSANIFGGRGVTVKMVPGRTAQDMKFPDAPQTLKMACGENPKRVYGQGRGSSPYTRMGNKAEVRSAFINAQDYLDRWIDYERKKAAGEDAEAPSRDLSLETLAGVLNDEVLVHNHCYRADEMKHRLDIAEEFGYQITAFHHAVESYKIADTLAEADVCSAMWSDWWGFKMEAWDGIRENVPMVEAAGACAVLHSDSAQDIQRLNQEAAKAMAAANRVGLDVTREQAIGWITLNAAKILGIDEVTGSLEAGKNADVVIWDGDPFSVYSRTQQVYVDGARVFDRDDPARQGELDFTLGMLGEGAQ